MRGLIVRTGVVLCAALTSLPGPVSDCWNLPAAMAADEPSLPREAQALLARASALNSYRAKFILEAKEAGGEPVSMEGILSYKKPNLRRLELTVIKPEPSSQLLVSDGSAEWQYDRQENRVYKLSNPDVVPGPHQPFGEGEPGTFRFIDRIGLGKDARVRFEAVPRPAVVQDSPVPIQVLRVDIDPESGLVRELTLLDAQGQTVLSQKYADVEINVNFPAGTFAFTPPDGAAVEEIGPLPAAGSTE